MIAILLERNRKENSTSIYQVQNIKWGRQAQAIPGGMDDRRSVHQSPPEPKFPIIPG